MDRAGGARAWGRWPRLRCCRKTCRTSDEVVAHDNIGRGQWGRAEGRPVFRRPPGRMAHPTAYFESRVLPQRWRGPEQPSRQKRGARSARGRRALRASARGCRFPGRRAVSHRTSPAGDHFPPIPRGSLFGSSRLVTHRPPACDASRARSSPPNSPRARGFRAGHRNIHIRGPGQVSCDFAGSSCAAPKSARPADGNDVDGSPGAGPSGQRIGVFALGRRPNLAGPRHGRAPFCNQA